MASGTGNSFVGIPSSADNSSILSAAYPHGTPGGMNSHISSIESVGSTPTSVPYTFPLMGGRRRPKVGRTAKRQTGRSLGMIPGRNVRSVGIRTIRRRRQTLQMRGNVRKCKCIRSTRIRGRGRSSRYRRYAR